MQGYLTDSELPLRLKKLAFKWRTRMIKVGWNYGEKEKCPICLEEDDTQTHLLECSSLNSPSLPPPTSDDSYSLLNHMKDVDAAIRRREIVMEQRKNADVKS